MVALEDVLAGWIVERLGRASGAAVDERAARAAIARTLSASRRAACATKVDEALAERIAEMLRTATAELARTLPLDEPPAIPRVVVVSDAGEDAAATLAATLRERTATDEETLVFTSTPAAAAAEADATVTVHAVPDDLRELERTMTFEDAPPPEGGHHRYVGDLVGQVLRGKYRVLALVGQGGFGEVYEAEDVTLGTRVALKVLKPARRSAADVDDFKEEARRVTRLNHPNIVDWKVFEDMGDGSFYFVMELLRGEELQETIAREEVLEPARAGRLLLQILDALRAAHHLGPNEHVLHLDVKPQNVFVVRGTTEEGIDERAKVIDFGIGQHVGGASAQSARGATPAPPLRDPELAFEGSEEAGTLVSVRDDEVPAAPSSIVRCRACTPEYASPEQCAHLLHDTEMVPLDGRSDLYSFGVMAFRMATGRLPFDAPDDRRQWLRVHREKEPLRVRAVNRSVPRPLAAFIDRCLRKDRDARWRDTNQAYAALYEVVYPPLWKKALEGAGISAAIALVAFGLYELFRAEEPLPFDLIEGGAIVQSELWFGPATPERTLELSETELPDPSASLRLLAKRGDAAEIDGWSAAWDGDDVRVTWNEGGSAKRADAFLEVDGDELRYSNVLTLASVPRTSWSLDRVRVQGVTDLAARTLDPRGAQLQILVTAANDVAASALRSVRVEHDDALFDARRGALVGGELTYVFDLHELGLDAPGPLELVVRAEDRAGRSEPLRIATYADPRDLAVTAALDGIFRGDDGAYQIRPTTDLTLAVTANRPARLEYEVRDASSDELLREPQAIASGVREARFDALELAALRGGEDYRGELRVVATDEVLGSSGGSRAEHVVTFELRTRTTDFGTTVDGRPVRAGEPIHLGAATCAVQLVPTQQLATLFRVTSGSSVVGLPFQKDVRGGTPADLELGFSGDGVHELVAEAYPFESGAAPPEPDVRVPLTFVVDTTPPALAWTRVPAVVRDEPAPAVLSALDTNETTLAWSLSDARDRPVAIDVSALPRTGGPDLAVPLSPPAGASDGAYVLVVDARDRAGHTARAEARFELARSGPAIDLPPIRAPWAADNDGTFVVRATIDDPNGVGRVVARLTSDSPAPLERTTELERTSGSRWKGAFELTSLWSQRAVTIAIEAADEHGLESEAETATTLAEILPVYPDALEVECPRHSIGSMRRVAVDRDLPYVFGGDLESVRRERLDRAGLPAPAALQDGWRSRYQPGEIRPYYLDEHEVTCAEFAAFVADGYEERSHWPSGAVVPLSAELSARLAPTPDLPVTGVTWAQAAAYARWAGKRLPSVVEWEHAVRGGAEMRVYASQTGSTPPRPDEVNYASSGPWAVGRGNDIARDGLRDLAGNVREWSTTPLSFSGPEPENVGAYAVANRDGYLDPRTREGWDLRPAYWVVGGSYASRKHYDFSRIVWRARDETADDVGFRCALDAAVLLDALGSAGGTLQHACDGETRR